MKEILKKMLETRKKKLEVLQARSQVSESVDEVRSIGLEIDGVNDEIRDIEAQISAIDSNPAPANPEERGFNPLATYGLGTGNTRNTDATGTDSIEYRTAFMNEVLRKIPISSEIRANANTTTSDATSAIPTVLVNEIIEKMDSMGMILPLITKTNFAAGIVIPTSNVKPVATWVAEGKTSEKQKKTTGKITFSYFKLRCEISMSMEVGTMALSSFEAKFVENVAKAMVKAREQAIINGEGTGSPKGILKETAPEGQALKVTKAGKLDYKLLCDMEAAVPEEYEATAKWAMSKKTFMSFIGMTDASGQPIARITYGISGKPERYLMGREVVVNPYVANYADAVTSDTTFAFIFDFSDYVENMIYDMGIQKKQDWDTEDLLTKAVTSVDGKVIDVSSLVTLTKTAA